MTTLRDFIGSNLTLNKTTQNGNIFIDENDRACLLKPVNRSYNGVKKKPLFFIESLEDGRATYLSGLFKTSQRFVFSGDYKDELGLKHLIHISFSDDAQQIQIKEAPCH